jgi:hypothetical protein
MLPAAAAPVWRARVLPGWQPAGEDTSRLSRKHEALRALNKCIDGLDLGANMGVPRARSFSTPKPAL